MAQTDAHPVLGLLIKNSSTYNQLIQWKKQTNQPNQTPSRNLIWLHFSLIEQQYQRQLLSWLFWESASWNLFSLLQLLRGGSEISDLNTALCGHRYFLSGWVILARVLALSCTEWFSRVSQRPWHYRIDDFGAESCGVGMWEPPLAAPGILQHPSQRWEWPITCGISGRSTCLSACLRVER